MKSIRKIGAFLLMMALFAGMISPVKDSSAETKKKFTISFNSNDGSGVVMKITQTEDFSVQIPQCNIRHDGFNFLGWNTDRNAKNAQYRYGNTINEKNELTLYAIWQKSGDYSWSYVKPEREITVNPQTFTYGKTVKVASTVSEPAEMSYVSHDEKVLKFSGSKGTAVSCGTVDVDVIAIEDGLHAASTKTVTLTIKPQKAAFTSASSPSRGRITCKWKKCTGATGYQVKVKKSGKTTIIDVKKNKFSAGNATSGVKYSLWVRAYKKLKSGRAYGAWSKVKKVTIK